jgi:hypothetical protein
VAQLYLHGREISTVFDLLGDRENDITFSIGWALSRCEPFLRAVLANLFPAAKYDAMTNVWLQQHSKSGGFTDIEIKGNNLHCIIEAKRGWSLPTEDQLWKYAKRIDKGVRWKALTVTSECSREYAAKYLPESISGIPVLYRDWKHIGMLAGRSRQSATHAGKRLLAEITNYLGSLMTMQNQESNLVYVIALGGPEIQRWSGESWRAHVINRKVFHQSTDAHWPKVPPTFLGFRYDGKLQSIHYVNTYEIIINLSDRVPVLHDKKQMNKKRHFCTLGDPIKPAHEVKSTNIRDRRVWAALDLLLTCRTIPQAAEQTKKRLNRSKVAIAQ